uniref:HDC05732 n=2 Tax=Drosophila melanogaster TaxID=7227 RepID=Q6IGP6_DROME|nr:uncharacterized protein Dmel_CG34224 [Drosophila melanogaster]ABV53761.1 uncharacterized protein Dmel_CG34224 [Drosophila melanogaster]DAA02418.1 TPA_inf: HDC05732 [Drosophila melanogaster]|eukprot:NP_001097266.1 uncharacterized protein Dmel_CG34224 [Drosophila melanogaster]
MNYCALNCILIAIPILLLLMDICEAKPWWPTNEAGYDASLDPIAWSRSFVPDQVRKTRYNVIPEPRSKHRHRQSSKLWYQKAITTYPKQFNVNAKYYKRYLRRRQKLAARERFANWRQ